MRGWWNTGLPEFSPMAIVLAEWVPIALTIIIGGLFATILFPRWQDRYIKRKVLAERQQSIIEETAELLNAYTNVWRRLIEISKHEASLLEDGRDIEKAIEMKAQFVSQRAAVHDRLMANLSRAKVLVSTTQRHEISEFIEWAESMSTLTLEELPEVSAWRTWEEKLLTSLQFH